MHILFFINCESADCFNISAPDAASSAEVIFPSAAQRGGMFDCVASPFTITGTAFQTGVSTFYSQKKQNNPCSELTDKGNESINHRRR